MNNNKKLLSFFYFVQEKCKFDDQNHLLNFIVRSISKWHRLHVAHKLNCLFPYYKLKMVAFVKKPSGWLLVRHFSQELLLLTYLLEKGDLKLPRNCHPYCKATLFCTNIVLFYCCYPGQVIIMIDWVYIRNWIFGCQDVLKASSVESNLP